MFEYVVDGTPTSALGREWHALLSGMRIDHPDPAALVRLTLIAPGEFPRLWLQATVRDSDDARLWRTEMSVHTTTLTVWPGARAAAMFVGIMWTGYMTHESLELVRAGGERILDPHAAPYHADHAFRRAAPSVLTRETLRTALAVVLPALLVEELVP